MARNEGNSLRLKNPDSLNQGMQVLREYIYFSKLNFYNACRKYDQQNTGTMPEKYLKQILLIELKDSPFYFTENNFNLILQECPIHPTTKYIDYQSLHDALANGPKPASSIHIFTNTMLKIKQGQTRLSEKQIIEDLFRLFKQETSNFFESKPYFDFKSNDLTKLNLDLLTSQSVNIKYNDTVQEKFDGFLKLNNQIIIDNFQAQVSKRIAYNALPQSSTMFIPEEKMEQAVLEFLGGKRGQRMFPNILKGEFILSLMKTKVSQVELTIDEYELLYWLIWKNSGFGEISIRTITKWVLEYRVKLIKELIKVYEKSQNILNQGLETPSIFIDLVKISKIYGIGLLKSVLSPFLDDEKRFELENIKILLRSLEIDFQQNDLNEFKFFLATLGITVMKDNKSSMGKIQVDQDKLLLEIQKHIDKLYAPPKQKTNISQFSELPPVDQAFISLGQQIMQTFVIKIKQKTVLYNDSDQMIDELKLRIVMSDIIDNLDHEMLSKIINSLSHSIQPNIYNPVRKIYLPEFFDIFEKKLLLYTTLIAETAKQDIPEKKEVVILENNEGLVLKGFGNLKSASLQGKFVNAPDKAFSVLPIDDKKIMKKLQLGLEKFFTTEGQYENESSYRRVEIVCECFYKYLKGFDPYNKSSIEKYKFIDILRDMFPTFTWTEINSIIDFALNVSRVEDQNGSQLDQISYPFLCLQLNKYYSMTQLIEVMNSVQQ